MGTSNRHKVSVHLQPDVHRALKEKSASIDCTISDIVNEAVRDRLAEDAFDLAVIEERRHESSLPFEDVLKNLRNAGRL